MRTDRIAMLDRAVLENSQGCIANRDRWHWQLQRQEKLKRSIVLLLVVYRFCDTTGQQLCQLHEPTKNLVCRAYHADPKTHYSIAHHLSDELLA
jgi:hypothetical protein